MGEIKRKRRAGDSDKEERAKYKDGHNSQLKKTSDRSIESSELLPHQNSNALQNISRAFDCSKSKSIPISIKFSKNYNQKPLKEIPPTAFDVSLSIFNSPLRYFLHPSKTAVIINERLPVLSALCMRALPLKAEGNGGVDRRGGAWVTHVHTGIHRRTQATSQGHRPTPTKPKRLIILYTPLVNINM